MMNPLNGTPRYMFTTFQVEDSPSFVNELEKYLEGTPVRIANSTIADGKLVELEICSSGNSMNKKFVSIKPTDWIVINNLTAEVCGLSDELYCKIFGVGGFSNNERWFPGG